MKVQKMSLTNVQGKLSRSEMKNIMAGSGIPNTCNSYCGTGTGVICGAWCPYCRDAGNASGVGPGQDKFCTVN